MLGRGKTKQLFREAIEQAASEVAKAPNKGRIRRDRKRRVRYQRLQAEHHESRPLYELPPSSLTNGNSDQYLVNRGSDPTDFLLPTDAALVVDVVRQPVGEAGFVVSRRFQQRRKTVSMRLVNM